MSIKRYVVAEVNDWSYNSVPAAENLGGDLEVDDCVSLHVFVR